MGYGPRDHKESDTTDRLTCSLSNKGRQGEIHTQSLAGEI